MARLRPRASSRPPVNWAGVDEEFLVICPYCGEAVEIFLEADLAGSLIQDCEVCCRPWLVRITGEASGRRVDVSRADGSD